MSPPFQPPDPEMALVQIAQHYAAYAAHYAAVRSRLGGNTDAATMHYFSDRFGPDTPLSADMDHASYLITRWQQMHRELEQWVQDWCDRYPVP